MIINVPKALTTAGAAGDLVVAVKFSFFRAIDDFAVEFLKVSVFVITFICFV